MRRSLPSLAVALLAVACGEPAAVPTAPSAAVVAPTFSVLSGNLILHTQAEVDAARGITEVTGYLTIWETANITNLDGLADLKSVGKQVFIVDNAALANIDGLAGLTAVGGFLAIEDNGALTDVDGLANLTSVEGGVSIFNCDALTNVDGLANLTSLTGLFIANNAALANLDGLSSLSSIGHLLTLDRNPALVDLDGLSGLTSVGGDLEIIQNEALASVDGLANLTSVGGDMIVQGNQALRSIGLSSLTSIVGDLVLLLTSLTDVDGLSNLTSVGGEVRMFANDALTNLDGLSSLISVGGDISITGNSTLAECVCGLYPLLSGGGVAGAVVIEDNAPSGGCNSSEGILGQNVSVCSWTRRWVTGGGWVDSPQGAYVPDPSLDGRASFGLTAKYRKGADVPTGNVQFQMKGARLSFRSTGFDWLVTGAASARLRGSGTVNGQTGYAFLIWVNDDPDAIRIRIWPEGTVGEVEVYDTGTNVALGGGNIAMHER